MAIVSAVLDTNVIVSGLAYPNSVPGRLLASWRSGRLRLCTSRFIVDEVARVLPRLTRANLTSTEARVLADSFLFLADVVEPVAIDEPALADRDDLPVLPTLIVAEADWLVTGDHQLLALADRYPILTPTDCWDRISGL